MNRTQELFSDAMSELDSRYLEPMLSKLSDLSEQPGATAPQAPSQKAGQGEKTDNSSKKWWKSYRTFSALAACLCLAVSGIGLHFWLQAGSRQASEKSWPVKKLPYPIESAESESEDSEEYTEDVLWPDELAEVPHWEDLPIYGQYASITAEEGDTAELSYSAHAVTLLPEQLELDAGIPATAIGWDEYADVAGQDGTRTCPATLYPILGISRECALAVHYEGTDAYYASVNSLYRPQTLGQFAEHLNLAETLHFNYALYEYTKSSGETAIVQFDTLDGDRLWQLLSAAPEAENEYSDLDPFPFHHQKLLDFSISVPLLGYENISISLWDGGYLATNILDTGKRFHIGEEAMQEVLDYILNECEGYEIIYTYEEDKNDPGIPE